MLTDTVSDFLYGIWNALSVFLNICWTCFWCLVLIEELYLLFIEFLVLDCRFRAVITIFIITANISNAEDLRNLFLLTCTCCDLFNHPSTLIIVQWNWKLTSCTMAPPSVQTWSCNHLRHRTKMCSQSTWTYENVKNKKTWKRFISSLTVVQK